MKIWGACKVYSCLYGDLVTVFALGIQCKYFAREGEDEVDDFCHCQHLMLCVQCILRDGTV